MKTGLTTFYHIHHYGAVLQACATQQAVRSLGSECEIINYYVHQDNALFQKPSSVHAAASDVHTALHYNVLKTRYDRFERFAAEHLSLTGHRYESFDELRNNCPAYDVYLSGSDQIWNPKIFPDGRFDPVYFGAFAPGRKIAYAPSFGIPSIPDGMTEELRTYLAGFSHIAVRERQGQQIVREITGREVPVVLDPTLLLRQEQWAALAAPPLFPDGYILCYCISKPGALSPYIERLAAETGLPVVQLCGIRQKVHPGAHCVMSAGPAEFLSLFRSASYVCTNSFHGTVFSVQFQKPFFTAVAPSEMAAPERSRTYSLLSTLGLTGRIIGKGDTDDLGILIDYAAVERRLEEARGSSLAYLADALAGRPCEGEASLKTAEEASGLPKLADHSLCTGCDACRSGCPTGAIEMERDKEGFLYPRVDPARCVHCGACTAVCPVLNQRERRQLPAVFAAWNRDELIRRDSTSGGVFSALAEDTLESGGVVFGAAMDDRQHLRHIACFQKKDLWRLRGAKYVQSDLGNTYQEVKELLKTRPVLFSGTPCQVDGLYRFLGERPENLTTCDLVCHGVPSPGGWEDLVRLTEQEKKKAIKGVRFRNKVTGWKDSHLTLLYADGAVDSAPLFHTEFGRAFGRALFLRPSCYQCPYTSMNRVGDFTLGDFWGLRPDELPEQQLQGVSLLMINTAHASHVFDRLPLGRVPFPPERAIAGNPRLASPIARPADRTAFFAAYQMEPFARVRRQFLKLPPAPVRAAAHVLTPEVKARIKRVLKK